MKVLGVIVIILWVATIFGCGGGKEPTEPVIEIPQTPEELAQVLLDRAISEKSKRLPQLALDTLKLLIDQYPDTKQAEEAKTIIPELEETLESNLTVTESLQKGLDSDPFAEILRVDGQGEESGYGFYYDSETYEISGDKLYLVFRWSGSGQANVRMVIENRSDEEALKIVKYQFSVDGNNMEFIPRADQVTIETVDDGVVETYNTRPTMAQRTLIEDIIASQTATLVVEGENASSERELTDIEKKGLAEVWTAFLSIGGIW